MKKIAILTDSSSGITKAEQLEHGIELIPLHIIIGEQDILDTPENIQKYDIYQQIMDGKVVKTSQASVYELEQKYDELLAKYDQVLHYPIAEKLSGQYESAANLAQQDKYRDRVRVIQNHTAAYALKRLVFFAQELVTQGCAIDEIIKQTNQFEQESFMAMIPGDINQLAHGGRAKKVLVSIINLLKIKILLEWSANPKRIASSRTVGKLIENAIELFKNKMNLTSMKYNLYILKNNLCKSSIWRVIEDALKKSGISFQEADLADIFYMHAGMDTIGIVGLPIKYETNQK